MDLMDVYGLTNLIKVPTRVGKWGKLLSDALDVHVPVKRSISKRQHVPFMTLELLGSIRHRNKLRELYFNSKDPENWEKYRLQRNLTSS